MICIDDQEQTLHEIGIDATDTYFVCAVCGEEWLFNPLMFKHSTAQMQGSGRWRIAQGYAEREQSVMYDNENGAAFIILTGTVVFYGLVYCFVRQVGRRQQKEIQKGSDALMQHLLHKRCENPYCTHYFKAIKTVDEECRHCSYALIEMGLEEVTDMEDTREAELQIKQGDINMALRYSDLLRQFLPGGLKHEEAIMLAMIERRNNGVFSWHPTGEYTLPVSEDNVILRNQRDRWRSEMNR